MDSCSAAFARGAACCGPTNFTHLVRELRVLARRRAEPARLPLDPGVQGGLPACLDSMRQACPCPDRPAVIAALWVGVSTWLR